MRRLFGSLYFIVFFATVLSIVVLWRLSLSSTQLEDSIYRGSFYLLDKHLQSHGFGDEFRQKVSPDMAYRVDLKSIDQLDFSATETQQLAEQKTLLKSLGGADFVYRQSIYKSGYVWELQTEQMDSEDIHLTGFATAKLIEDYLHAYPVQQWQQKLDQIKAEFGIPLSLIPVSQAEQQIPEQRLSQFRANKIVSDDDGIYSGDRYFYRIAESAWVLVVGPANIGLIEHAISAIGVLSTILILFAIMLAIAVLIWLWPMWRNLTALLRAAEQFGKGNFDARAKTGIFSPIALMSESFNAMAARIQVLITAQKQLSNAVSHELRTPLARMRFGLEELVEADTEEQRAYFYQEVLTDINELDSLVNELLIYATFEQTRPTMELTSFPIRHWLTQWLARAKPKARTLDCQLIFDGVNADAAGRFDSRLLSRALTNLLNNASRYARTTIRVTMRLQDDNYQFIIEDDGIGVPQEFREVIFEPFQRVDSSRHRDTGGYGIGLSIVRQIAEWHNGQCWVDESALGGARFILTIPQKN